MGFLSSDFCLSTVSPPLKKINIQQIITEMLEILHDQSSSQV